MREEVRILDRDGSWLPDNALNSCGILYAPVAKMQRLRSIAYMLSVRAYELHGYSCMEYRDLMCLRAEERARDAYDAYLERCKGITEIVVRYYSDSPECEGHSSSRVIE